MIVLICIYLVTSEIEQLFISLLAIWLSYCDVPVQIFSLLLNYVCWYSLYILEWYSLIVYDENIFATLFMPLIMFFDKQKIFILT